MVVKTNFKQAEYDKVVSSIFHLTWTLSTKTSDLICIVQASHDVV